LRDQAQANRSAFHVASFFATLQPILMQARAEGRRVFLLAHSMGNFALAAAVESWFSHSNPTVPLFDEVFLPAADERWDSFTLPVGARLTRLSALCPRISIYYSVRDIALYLSVSVNFIPRVGHEGPIHKSDAALYPPARFRMLDCTEAKDYDLWSPPDASHQYYRRSPKVRADIVAAMRKDANLPGGLIQL
jgi:esterase/lipase superfamily enzyme